MNLFITVTATNSLLDFPMNVAPKCSTETSLDFDR